MKIEFDPCCISFAPEKQYMFVGGTHCKVSMFTPSGQFIHHVAEQSDWIWSIDASRSSKHVTTGTNNGLISCHKLIISTVHGLYGSKYAFRNNNLTHVTVQNLESTKNVTIPTTSYVKKIAIFKHLLAIQLNDQIKIYSSNERNPSDIQYKLKDTITQNLKCNLLVVTNNNLVLCQEKSLDLYSFQGKKLTKWSFESTIRYIKVTGGVAGNEGLLLGLKNGNVYKIFIQHKQPILLLEHQAPIRCLDLSAMRTKVALVDEFNKIYIYDLQTSEPKTLFTDTNANSVAWNSEFEEMFAYSGGNTLCIKTGTFPAFKQKMKGFVVGFKSSKVFCLHYNSIQAIDIPQSKPMRNYIADNEFQQAYSIACLGVTDEDWKYMALQALES